MDRSSIEMLKILTDQLTVSLLEDEHGLDNKNFILLQEISRLLGFDLGELDLKTSEGRVFLNSFPTEYT